MPVSNLKPFRFKKMTKIALKTASEGDISPLSLSSLDASPLNATTCDNTLHASPVDFKISIPKAYTEVCEICVRAGIFQPGAKWPQQNGVPVVPPIPISPCWLAAPRMINGGQPHLTALALLADLVSEQLSMAVHDVAISEQSRQLSEATHSGDYDDNDYYLALEYEFLEYEFLSLESVPETTLGRLARCHKITISEVFEALKFLEKRQLISVHDFHRLPLNTAFWGSSFGRHEEYEEIGEPNELDHELSIDIITPSLAEITLSAVDLDAPNDAVAPRFLFDLAQGQWQRSQWWGRCPLPSRLTTRQQEEDEKAQAVKRLEDINQFDGDPFAEDPSDEVVDKIN